MAVNIKYFGSVGYAIRKNEENYDLKKETTVENLVDELASKYGEKFSKPLYSTFVHDGKEQKTPNLHLNKKRIQWIQDFPDGIETKLKDGDELWLGLIVGGG